MNAMLTGLYPEALCPACRAGQHHSLRIHAKLLLAICDADMPAESSDEQAPAVRPSSDPRPSAVLVPPAPILPPSGDGEELDAEELDSVLTRTTAPAFGQRIPLMPVRAPALALVTPSPRPATPVAPPAPIKAPAPVARAPKAATVIY